MFSDKKKLSASSTSSAALEDSHTRLSGYAQQELFAQLPSANKTSFAKPSSESTGPTPQSSTTLDNLEARNPHSQMVLISSAAGSRSRVSLGPKPGSSEARKMTETSGRKWLGLLQSYGLNISLARMCAALLTNKWASNAAYLTWKASATKPSHLLFQLAPLMPRTGVTASGLLHTPTAKANQMAPSMKERDPGSWWPTPTARDWKGGYTTNASTRKDGKSRATDSLENVAMGGVGAEKYSGQLNPTWVEWLMGFPTGWTDLKPSEMPSSRKSSRKSEER